MVRVRPTFLNMFKYNSLLLIRIPYILTILHHFTLTFLTKQFPQTCIALRRANDSAISLSLLSRSSSRMYFRCESIDWLQETVDLKDCDLVRNCSFFDSFQLGSRYNFLRVSPRCKFLAVSFSKGERALSSMLLMRLQAHSEREAERCLALSRKFERTVILCS